MVNKAKSLLLDSRKLLQVSIPVPVIDCSGTGPSGTDLSSSLAQPEQPECTKFDVAAKFDTAPGIEAKTQETETIHEDINDSMASKVVLECKAPCHSGHLDPADEKISNSNQNQKYDAETCLSMILLDPVEVSSKDSDSVKHQGKYVHTGLQSHMGEVWKCLLLFQTEMKLLVVYN